MAKKPKQNDNEFTFDDNSVKNRVGLKLFRAVLFTGLFYILGCFLLNFLILTVKGLNASGQITFKFKIDYLRVPPDGFSPVMLLMISLMVSMVVVIRLETTYRIKNENKSLKGKQRWMNDKELKETFYSFPADKPSSAKKSGIIVALKNGRYYVDVETIHNLIIGTTRSGKGQTFVMPMVRHICYSEAKHSMVLNDPKGELLENCYDMLIENGYDVKVLNLRDTDKSSLWNPLQTIIDEYQKYLNETDPNKKDLSKTVKYVQSLAQVFTQNDKSDPIWPESAKSLLVAMILYMLEKAGEDGHFANVSMYSIYNFFVEFGSENEVQIVNGAKRDVNALDQLFQGLPIGSAAKNAYATSRFSSGDTRASIFTTLASNINLFGSDMGISRLTSGNQIDFKELANPDKPLAIFMVVPDEDKSRHIIASLFVNQCYNALVEYASNFTGQKLPQRVHFILDEFGNMVPIPAMDTKITVGAGRNLLFSMFVQDLNQLDTKYNNEAKTIRSSSGNQIYINSLDKDTNEYFSAILGNRTVEYMTYSGDLHSFLSHKQGAVDSRPLVSAEELGEMKFGDAITKRQRCFPVRTHLKPFYEFGVEPKSIDVISSTMQLIHKPLSETIYPLETIWEVLFKPMTDKDGFMYKQETNALGEVRRYRKMANDSNAQWAEINPAESALNAKIYEACTALISSDGNSRTEWDTKRLSLLEKKKSELPPPTTDNTDYTDNVDKVENSVLTIALEKINNVPFAEVGAYTNFINNKNFVSAKKLVARAASSGHITAAERNILKHNIEGYYNN